jgi:hypothetical protein
MQTLSKVSISSDQARILMQQLPEYSLYFATFENSPELFQIKIGEVLDRKSLLLISRSRLEHLRSEQKVEVLGLAKLIDRLEVFQDSQVIGISINCLEQHDPRYSLFANANLTEAFGCLFYEKGKVVTIPLI